MGSPPVTSSIEASHTFNATPRGTSGVPRFACLCSRLSELASTRFARRLFILRALSCAREMSSQPSPPRNLTWNRLGHPSARRRDILTVLGGYLCAQLRFHQSPSTTVWPTRVA
jgi:hypothetical protein